MTDLSSHTVSSPNLRVRGHQVVRWLCAAVLILAALAKGYQLATQPVAENRAWWLVIVNAQWILGLMLAGGLLPRLLWSVTLLTFGTFAAISGYHLAAGERSCGCFGSLEVNPGFTLAFDLAIIALLVIFRPPSPERTPMMQPKIVTLLALAGLIVSVVAASAFEASSLREDGQVVGDSREVVLRPEQWLGKPLPLLAHIDIADQIKQGNWNILLYHHDCPKCRIVLKEWSTMTIDTGRQLAIIELPPYGKHHVAEDSGGALRGRLADTHDWFVTTPTIMSLNDGIVEQVTIDGKHAVGGPADQIHHAAAMEHDLGYVKPGSIHQLRFKLANDSERPLTIKTIRPECSCMQPIDPPQSIAAQASADLHVSFHAFESVMNYSKRIVVELADRPPITLTIKARIGLPLVVEPDPLKFRAIPGDDHERNAERAVTIRNDGPVPIRLLYATTSDRSFTAKIPNITLEPNGGTAQIPILYAADEADAKHQATITIHTNAKTQRTLSFSTEGATAR